MNVADSAIAGLGRGIWAPGCESWARSATRRGGVCSGERASSRPVEAAREAFGAGTRVRQRGAGCVRTGERGDEFVADWRSAVALDSRGAAGGCGGAPRAGRGGRGVHRGRARAIGGGATGGRVPQVGSRCRGVRQRGRLWVIGGGASLGWVGRWVAAERQAARLGGAMRGGVAWLGPIARRAGARWGASPVGSLQGVRVSTGPLPWRVARGRGVGGGPEPLGPSPRLLRDNSALERTAAAAWAALLRCISRPPRPLNLYVRPERTRR